MAKKDIFIELSITRWHSRKIDLEKGTKKRLPKMFSSKNWIEITDPEEFLKMWSNSERERAEHMDDYWHFIHVADPVFKVLPEYDEIRTTIYSHYGEKLELLLYKKGFNATAIKQANVYELIHIIKEEYNEKVIFNIGDTEIEIMSLSENDRKEEFEEMSRDGLRLECKSKGLSQAGSKKELIKRLTA